VCSEVTKISAAQGRPTGATPFPCARGLNPRPRGGRWQPLGALLLILLAACNRGALEPVVVAVSAQPMSAPIYVAETQGFFREQGLDVTLLPSTSGHAALSAVLDRQAEFGTATEVPLMFAGLAGVPVSIVATIADSNTHMAILTHDTQIRSPKDIAGKTIGVMPGTNAEYFLHVFAIFHEIDESAVRRVDLRPEAMLDALLNDEVDAVVVWNPHADTIAQSLGPDAGFLRNPYVYNCFYNVAVHNDFAASRPETIAKFLHALVQAEAFIIRNPEKSEAIVAEHLGGAPFSLRDYDFDLSLSESLLLSLEDQARWATGVKQLDSRGSVNFLDFIYLDGMRQVAPESVTVSGGS
jgi:NitT/TauT family transport system substrate-binding protein